MHQHDFNNNFLSFISPSSKVKWEWTHQGVPLASHKTCDVSMYCLFSCCKNILHFLLRLAKLSTSREMRQNSSNRRPSGLVHSCHYISLHIFIKLFWAFRFKNWPSKSQNGSFWIQTWHIFLGIFVNFRFLSKNWP